MCMYGLTSSFTDVSEQKEKNSARLLTVSSHNDIMWEIPLLSLYYKWETA